MSGGGFSVRMVTLHASRVEWWERLGEVEDAAYALLEAVDTAVGEGYPRPESVRLALPPAPGLGVAADLADELGEIAERAGILVNAGYYPSSTSDLESLVRSTVVEGVYISLILDEASWEQAGRIARAANLVAEEDPTAATRFGVNTLGAPVETPFFPLSASTGRSLVSVGFTYPSFLLSAYLDGGLPAVEDAIARAGSVGEGLAERVAGLVGTEASGVDLSIAPWMADSSLALVEAISGTRLPEPGIALGISLANRAIAGASEKLGGTLGFNEVQLPVAEDARLKARVSEGDTRARDLARLAGACLAGLDMVVIPYDERRIAGLILEVASYALSKGRPLGVRVIPLEGVEAGDKVSLGRFGETPVIDI